MPWHEQWFYVITENRSWGKQVINYSKKENWSSVNTTKTTEYAYLRIQNIRHSSTFNYENHIPEKKNWRKFYKVIISIVNKYGIESIPPIIFKDDSGFWL